MNPRLRSVELRVEEPLHPVIADTTIKGLGWLAKDTRYVSTTEGPAKMVGDDQLQANPKTW